MHFGVYAYLPKIEKFLKNKHSHMFDIGVYAYLRALFFRNSEEFGQVSVDYVRAFSDSLLGLNTQFFKVTKCKKKPLL